MERTRATVKIQSLWRRYDAIVELHLRFIEREAATAIQQAWRGYRHRALYAHKIDCVIYIQAIARAYLTRHEIWLRNESSISIQRIWRGFWAQLQTQLDFLDVITVQSIVRRRLALMEIDRRRHGVFVLQRNVRRFLAIRTVNQMRKDRQEWLQHITAAIACQVSIQGSFARAPHHIICGSNEWILFAILQSAARRFLAMHLFRRKHRETSAALMLQTQWRAAKRRHEFHSMKRAATMLQAFFRGVSIREIVSLKTGSAIIIERTWRCYLARTLFMSNMKSVVLVQAVIRSWAVRFHLASQDWAATMIQSKWRGYSALTSYRNKLFLAIVAQSIYRGLLVRRELRFLDACASAIQATWRCYMAKLQYQLDLVEIIIAQNAVRRRMAEMELRRRKAAVLVMQSFLRMCAARKKRMRLLEEDLERKEQNAASICLQVRGVTCECFNFVHTIRQLNLTVIPRPYSRAWRVAI